MSKLEGNKIKEYWDKRSSLQGDRTVGFGNQPITVQDENYRQRYEFVVPCLDNNRMTLDFGCGIGRYTDFFKPEKYIGVDVCLNLLERAQENNTDYKFVYIPNGVIETLDTEPIEQVFTATVLQHNSDRQVIEILKSWKPYVSNICCFVLYENCHNVNDADHIAFRQPERYKDLISEVFEVTAWAYRIHVIHGEEHSVMSFDCCKKQ
jgi:SAM-dependent methyltransferase